MALESPLVVGLFAGASIALGTALLLGHRGESCSCHQDQCNGHQRSVEKSFETNGSLIFVDSFVANFEFMNMIYLFCTLGFIGGFILGQMVLAVLLHGKTRDELLENKSLRWYGLLNWIFAIGGASSSMIVYQQFFLP